MRYISFSEDTSTDPYDNLPTVIVSGTVEVSYVKNFTIEVEGNYTQEDIKRAIKAQDSPPKEMVELCEKFSYTTNSFLENSVYRKINDWEETKFEIIDKYEQTEK